VHGAVSPQVAEAMAAGARTRSHADIGLSVTGVAGPDGGTERKPVGLVYIGLATGSPSTRAQSREFRFSGNRKSIKLRASQAALDLLRRWLLSPTRRTAKSRRKK
jgi:nicotinamide-nucleotide amidase